MKIAVVIHLFCMVLTLALPCSAGTEDSSRFTILYSNNVNGETEPCG